MARYFFDFYDGKLDRDTTGTECSSPDEILHHAMQALPAMAKWEIPLDGQKQAFKVMVRNQNNLTVYAASLTFTGVWIGEDCPVAEELTE